MRLTLRYARQRTEYSCGPASLKMVFGFLGDKKSEKSLRKKARTNKISGTKHKWMIKTATQEGFHCYANSNSSLHEIKHFLVLGLPVIIDYTEPSQNIGHYSVIIGYKKNKIIMNDPWNGKDFTISEKKLANRWHDTITRSNGWIMVISKKDFLLGKQYLPKK